jgi:hypothetical protein
MFGAAHVAVERGIERGIIGDIMRLINKLLKKFHFHWQNLNELPGDVNKATGIPTHGRCWVTSRNDSLNTSLGIEWALGKKSEHCGISLNFMDGEDDILVSINIPYILGLYVSLERLGLDKAWKKWVGDCNDREISLSYNYGVLHWMLFSSSMVWSNKTPRWRDGSFNVIDFILGKKEYSKRVVSEREVVVPMPEGMYPATVTMFESKWERSRWFPERLLRADIRMIKPIPIPGKGSMSYNCDDDAIHGLTVPARNVEEAVGKLIGDALNTRMERQFSWDWEWN